jgi:uncharacterized membrane protein YgcG
MTSTGEAPPAEERSAGPSRAKEILVNFGQLGALSAFALAQPLFSLLKKNPEFFAARGSPGFDIISFSVLLVLLPPLALVLIELLVGLVSRPASRVLHVAFVGLGVALIAAQALKKAIGASDLVLIVLSVAIGVALALLYARTEGLRQFLTILSPVPIVFLALFLFTTPISKLAFPAEAQAKNVGGINRTNVVVVLFDEFPSTNLMDASHNVDAKRFPHFAELERNSTWFRNAYTVYDSTERAQPAIFDGDLPAKNKLPTSADHPNSIFTLFAKTHRLNVSEEATSVCPPKLCKNSTQADEPYNERLGSMTSDLGLVWLHVVAPPKAESKLPSVSQNWGNFGGGSGGGSSGGSGGGGGSKSSVNVHANLNSNRNHRFEQWIADIKNENKPALNFKHSLIPHVPWQYLPDGKQYRRTASDPIPGLSEFEYDDQQQVYSLWQRHLLQVGFADHLLGELIAHLKKEGLYDKSLIVVAADHGVAFDLGKRDRRTLTAQNYGEIAPIPLFMKAPGQKKGRINSSYVETIDILPTIFDILHLKPPVHMDGKSAFSETVKKRRELRILQRGTFKTLHFPVAQFEQRKDAALAKKLQLFGTGSMFAPRFYHWGPHADLIGKPASAAGPPLNVSFAHANEFKHVDLKSSTIPVHVVGKVRNAGAHRDVAIAINGKIVAVSSTFKLVSGDTKDVLIASMVPESAFHDGANDVQVLAVGG